MKTKARYFTETFFTMEDYIEFLSTLSHDDDELKLISVIEIDGIIILTLKEVYTVL